MELALISKRFASVAQNLLYMMAAPTFVSTHHYDVECHRSFDLKSGVSLLLQTISRRPELAVRLHSLEIWMCQNEPVHHDFEHPSSTVSLSTILRSPVRAQLQE
jgi:hypothetical protein